MVDNRRSSYEVIVDILVEATKGENKTRIMQRANLNHQRFHRYFPELLKRGVLAEENDIDGRVVYRTTEKGRDFIKLITRAEEIVFVTKQKRPNSWL
jgi:predicted transcriptional regulator